MGPNRFRYSDKLNQANGTTEEGDQNSAYFVVSRWGTEERLSIKHHQEHLSGDIRN